jgi:hypothetical protein
MEKKRRSLKIKTGSCRRLAVDINNYTQETVDFQEKINRAREEVRVIIIIATTTTTTTTITITIITPPCLEHGA